MISPTTSQQILEEFLSCPLNSADEIFARFESLPGAICGKGKKQLERYVCIPGSRENKIVLVAHADTVWDDAYGKGATTEISFADGIYKGTNPDCGLGADDRAGCAMLWALRESGHTLLLVNGEEKGKVGARFLRKSNPKLFRMLNRHQFMIELDWCGTERCLYNQVDFTNKFRDYITNVLGFHDDKRSGGCDLQILCQRISGVNIGVGYHWHHLTEEFMNLSEWETTLAHLQRFLALEHPRFGISILRRIKRKFGNMKNLFTRGIKKVKRLLKIEK